MIATWVFPRKTTATPLDEYAFVGDRGYLSPMTLQRFMSQLRLRGISRLLKDLRGFGKDMRPCQDRRSTYNDKGDKPSHAGQCI